MASIKMPIYYVKYQNSEEATEYSRKLAIHQARKFENSVMIFMVVWMVISGISVLFNSGTVSAIMVFLGAVLGVFAGNLYNKKLKMYYKAKRDAALRRDCTK